MKNATAAGKALQALLKKIGTPDVPELLPADDPVAILIYSFLVWETTVEKADAAYAKIVENVVDYNDLRVCMPHEIVEIIGERFPQAHERAQRLRATLRDVYLREHIVSLDSLAELGKRDLRKYVESLDGIPPYVAARLMLLCYDTHGIPVDEKLHWALVDTGVVDADDDLTEVGSWLTRQVKADDGAVTHQRLQAWCDTVVPTKRKVPKKAAAAAGTKKKTTTKKKATAKKAPSKKTTKKKTTTKTAARKSAAKKTTTRKAVTRKTKTTKKTSSSRKTTKKKAARSSA